MLTYHLLPLFPPVMRFYRSFMLVDLPALLKFLPEKGRLLDVGCGTGLLDYSIAQRRPDLQIVGIDVDTRAVELAARYNRRPNLTFEPTALADVQGKFDCISFVDVMHHTQEDEGRALLRDASRLLSPGGRIFIKDIARSGGWFSYYYDRFITRSDVIRLMNPNELLSAVTDGFRVVSSSQKYRLPFPNYYVVLEPKQEEKAPAAVDKRSVPS
jgi:2-polyprenyl-3-methyl-5-hydroxy-6-metoxy-1,4-benzoquinol methylase